MYSFYRIIGFKRSYILSVYRLKTAAQKQRRFLHSQVKAHAVNLRECLHEKTHTGASCIPGRLFHRVYMMTGSFHISLFEGKLHVDKIHVWFKIANTTHALPVPVYRQNDFTPKRVVVARLHDTVARFRTGVKFSPRYKNRGELTPGWLAPAWHFMVVSCKQM